MNISIFDTHTHLNDEVFRDKEIFYIENAKKMNVNKMVIVGSDYDLNKRAIYLSKKFNNLYAAIGWHPEMVDKYNLKEEKRLLYQLANNNIVAIGEIGLDYHFGDAYKEQQIQLFINQIRMSKNFHLPIIVHTRDAFDDTYNILKSFGLDYGGIIHSFTGDKKWAKKFLDLGMYISFSGIVTFKNAPLIQEAAKYVPLDRLLVETDAPLLSPVPFRGHRNEPGYTRYVLNYISQLRNIDLEKLAEITWNNSNRVYRLNEN